MTEAVEPDEAILRKVQAMLNLAAKAGTPEEAANAQAMAQRFMEQHNLSTAMLEKRAGKDGKREQAAVKGGNYIWQRQLWANIAHLNFCLYWTQEYAAVRERTERSIINPNRVYYKGERVMRKRHVLVGRTVNTLIAKAMGDYLEGTINRLLRERLTDSTGRLNNGEYNGSFGASFREGAADQMMIKMQDRHRKVLAAEARKKKAAEAAGSSGTDLVLSVYKDEETDANLDFLYGAGYSAKKAASIAAAAEEARIEREAYTAWAKANPEEAAEREKENQARRRRMGGSSGGAAYSRDRKRDWGAYNAGSKAAEKISIDPQVDKPAGPTARITGSKALHL